MCGFEPGLLNVWANYYEKKTTTKYMNQISPTIFYYYFKPESGAEKRIYAHYLQSHRGYMADGGEWQNLKWNGFFLYADEHYLAGV